MKIMAVNNCGGRNQNFGYINSPIAKEILSETAGKQTSSGGYPLAVTRFIKARFNLQKFAEPYLEKAKTIGNSAYNGVVDFLKTFDSSVLAVKGPNSGLNLAISDATAENNYKMTIGCGKQEILLKKFKDETEAKSYLQEQYATAENIDNFRKNIDVKVGNFMKDALNQKCYSAEKEFV